MKNYKLTLAYDGSRYKGWQRLGAGEVTIQDTVEDTIRKLTGQAVRVHGSGRTDAGVHARSQVISFKMDILLEKDFVQKLNERLPEDIKAIKIEKVSEDFHARYSAVAKTYSFYVDTKEKAEVFRIKYAYHFPWELNLEEMRQAAGHLQGTHDFSAFTDDKNSEKDKVRTITRIRITQEKGIVQFCYEGDGFLQHMVRIMTGTLLEIGRGDREPEDIKMILESKERAKAGFLVPAKGLFLDKVEY